MSIKTLNTVIQSITSRDTPMNRGDVTELEKATGQYASSKEQRALDAFKAAVCSGTVKTDADAKAMLDGFQPESQQQAALEAVRTVVSVPAGLAVFGLTGLFGSGANAGVIVAALLVAAAASPLSVPVGMAYAAKILFTD